LRLYKSIVTIGDSCDVWLETVNEVDEDNEREDVITEVLDESMPSQEAIKITNGKTIDKRFIIRNSLDG
jgi:hypothetical protein